MPQSIDINSEHKPFGYEVPFASWVGLEMVFFEAGKSKIRLTPRPELLNSMGMVHGGVIMTMLDVGMATAARSALKADALPGEEPRVITIEMKSSFMKPCMGKIEVRGTVLSHTRSMAFCEAEIVDAHERVCAKGSGTFRYVKPQIA